MGHGGTQHKRTPGIKARAIHMAQTLGYATLAIDGPGHGDRVTKEQREAAAKAAASGAPRVRDTTDHSPAHTAEWKAALDHAQALDFVGAGKVGYWGVSMGTRYGVPFVAAEPRITCAVFGLFPLMKGTFEAAARSITIPLEFVFQWEDELMTRDGGIELFNAFASTEKTMHINPGRHTGIPEFERASWEAFYVRHLGG